MGTNMEKSGEAEEFSQLDTNSTGSCIARTSLALSLTKFKRED